jgi:hypothetical protein
MRKNLFGAFASHQCITMLALLITAASFFAGCSDDEPPEGPCDATTVDPRVVGDWIACDDEWEYRSSGIRIEADGKVSRLIVDWTSGQVSALSEPLPLVEGLCARDGVLVWKKLWDNDTLTYVLSGDRMEWFEFNVIPWNRYRRVSLQQKIKEPAVLHFSAEVGGSLYLAEMLNPQFPALARLEACENGTDLELSCSQDTILRIIVHHFTGPGTYALGDINAKVSNASLTWFVDDMTYGAYTNEAHTGTVTVSSFDESASRCSGTFEFDVEDYDKNVIEVRHGIFDLPIRKSLN